MIEKLLMMTDDFTGFLINYGVDTDIVHYMRLAILSIALILLIVLVNFLAKKVIVEGVKRVFSFTKNKWDDVLIEKKVFNQLAHLVPAYILNMVTPSLFIDFPFWISYMNNAISIYVIIVVLMVALSFFNALEFYFSSSKKFKDKPIESYFQLAKLIFYFISGIFILSILIGKSPIYLLSAFGAMTAVILLLFKDTILGFVASIQIAANDMLKVGDWVEMNKYGADGDVVKITLNTVKVKNWDNTITTIPTYAFVSDSFKNWRGMQEIGSRRIKRHIFIRPNTIKFINNEMIKDFEDFQLITDYLQKVKKDIQSYNVDMKADKSATVNGRNLTNIGVFRKYLELYIANHNMVNQNMTLMVRQMQPNQFGVPLEVYCFAKTTEWVKYENIQSDIMDHIISATSSFGLEVYELNGVTNIAS
jgi:miniconductance mechanosensitive channel